MKPRVAAMLLALVLLGGIVGYAAALVTQDEPLKGAPGPAAASDPSVPSSPTPTVQLSPDADLPPFAGPFVQRRSAFIGTGPDRTRYTIPDGLLRRDDADGDPQTYWLLPDNPPGSYTVRVELLPPSLNRTTRQLVLERAAALQGDPDVNSDTVRVLASEEDSLTVSFVLSGYVKFSVIRFITVTDGKPDVEIAATGREVDLPGLQAAVALVAATAERRPEKPPKVKDPG